MLCSKKLSAFLDLWEKGATLCRKTPCLFLHMPHAELLAHMAEKTALTIRNRGLMPRETAVLPLCIRNDADLSKEFAHLHHLLQKKYARYKNSFEGIVTVDLSALLQSAPSESADAILAYLADTQGENRYYIFYASADEGESPWLLTMLERYFIICEIDDLKAEKKLLVLYTLDYLLAHGMKPTAEAQNVFSKHYLEKTSFSEIRVLCDKLIFHMTANNLTSLNKATLQAFLADQKPMTPKRPTVGLVKKGEKYVEM